MKTFADLGDKNITYK